MTKNPYVGVTVGLLCVLLAFVWLWLDIFGWVEQYLSPVLIHLPWWALALLLILTCASLAVAQVRLNVSAVLRGASVFGAIFFGSLVTASVDRHKVFGTVSLMVIALEVLAINPLINKHRAKAKMAQN